MATRYGGDDEGGYVWIDHTDDVPEIDDVRVWVGDRLIVTSTTRRIVEYPAKVFLSDIVASVVDVHEDGEWFASEFLGFEDSGDCRDDVADSIRRQCVNMGIEII